MDRNLGAGSILASELERITARAWARRVDPLFAQVWPQVRATSAYGKLRFLTCGLYAAAPFTALLLAAKRPLWLDFALMVAAATGPDEEALARRIGMAFRLAPVVLRDLDRRGVLIGAFVATVDHVFDHDLDHLAPDARASRLVDTLRGVEVPESGPLAAVRALQIAMEQATPSRDRAAYQEAFAAVFRWIEAERLALVGASDPEGLCHRLAGVRGTIDGITLPVRSKIDPPLRQWMVDCSLLVQMIDDDIDRDADAAAGRRTPALDGTWTSAQLLAQWGRARQELEALAARNAGPRVVDRELT